MLNAFLGGWGYFLCNLRLFTADTNQDIVPSLAVKYYIEEDFKFVAYDCIHLLIFLVTYGYFLCISVYLNIEK